MCSGSRQNDILGLTSRCMIKRLVLDVLKPHDPGMATFATGLDDRLTVSGITTTLVEIDENVRTVRVTVEGDDLDPDLVTDTIADLGGSVHSVDQVCCGDRIVEDQPISH